MGRVAQYNMTVKNSFVHFLDEVEEANSRNRSLSDFSGMSLVKGEKLQKPIMMTIGSDDQSTDDRSLDDRTTVMVRNIPNSYTSSSLIELFEAKGHYAKFDFVYLPIDFRTGVNLGYAFVNLISNMDAQQFIMDFNGFRGWSLESLKICEVSWADPYQGLDDHVERYRNSPVMHEKMPDEYKPRVYVAGVRVPFPEPTKRIRAPRMRPQRRI
jgi:RNA recognition motif-containing protein